MYSFALRHSLVRADQSVYKHLGLHRCQDKILSWIHKDNALPGSHPICSAVWHYPTVSFEEPLTTAWFRITPLLANSLSIRLQRPFAKLCLYSFFPPSFASPVWLNYVLRDVLWQTASPREVHFIHHWKQAAMRTAVKWFIFFFSFNHSGLSSSWHAKKNEETWIFWKRWGRMHKACLNVIHHFLRTVSFKLHSLHKSYRVMIIDEKISRF